MNGLFHDQFYILIVFLTGEISLSTLVFFLQCMFETIITVEVVIDFRIIKEGLGSVRLDTKMISLISNVYWTVHHCNS